jgi:hypothetical protein
MNLETLKVFTDWFARTELVLRREKTRLKVDDTTVLDSSLSHQVHQRANSLLQGELEFLVRGRFVDMGAGRKRKIETREGNLTLLTGRPRKPKKWYSRAFWGRLNDLQGILGYKLMEEAVDSIKDPIEMRSTGNVGNPKI